jgi:homoserine dehydrogenase
VALRREIVTTDADRVLEDPEIDLVIELIGGESDALGIISRALVLGRSVITANKAVISRHLPLLRRLEDLHGGHLLYGAAVCGSVPILKVIDETLLTDRIDSLRGVINGSTNYILSRLQAGSSWEETLEEARMAGFLEADPTADISGADAAQKLSILAYHAFGIHVPPERIATTGIDGIDAAEIARAGSAGKVIRLVASAQRSGEGLDLSVRPELLAAGDPLASVRDEANIVELDCRAIGPQRFTGRGAGSMPTANAVISDLLDIIAARRYRRRPRVAGHATVAGYEPREIVVAG